MILTEYMKKHRGVPELLRTASPANRTAGTVVTASSGLTRRLTMRLFRTIGSGDLKSLRIRIDNMIIKSNSTVGGPGNGWTIVRAAIETNSQTKQAFWGGAASRWVEDGEYEIYSDKLLPSQFGLSVFPKNSGLVLKLDLEVTGGSIPAMDNTDVGQTEGKYYDPAVITCTNFFGTGVLAFSGGTPSNVYGFPGILVGEYAAGDAPCWAMTGDSIIMQGGGASYAYRAITNDATQRISAMAMGRPGGASTIQQQYPEYFGSLIKLCNRCLDEYGTNEVGSGTLSSMQARWTANWTWLRSVARVHPNALPFKILRPSLLVRTSGDTASPSTQTVLTPWNAGQLVDNLYDWAVTQQGVGVGPDLVCDHTVGPFGTLRAASTGRGTTNSDWYKWAASKTSDNLHPLGSASNIVGDNLRPYIDMIG